MKVYPEVPVWWYASIFVICMGIAFGTTYGASSGLPWWALIVAVLFSGLFVPIIGTLYCTVGYAPSIENMVQVSISTTTVGRLYTERSLRVLDVGRSFGSWEACRKHVLHTLRIQPSQHGVELAT